MIDFEGCLLPLSKVGVPLLDGICCQLSMCQIPSNGQTYTMDIFVCLLCPFVCFVCRCLCVCPLGGFCHNALVCCRV